MALMSMTGYGGATMSVEGRSYRVEIRSVNHRGTNIRTTLPSELGRAEPAAKKLVRDRLGRGAIDVFVKMESSAPADHAIEIDRAGVQAMLSALQSLAADSGAPAPTLELVLRLGDFVSVRRKEVSEEALEEALIACLGTALDDLEGMRRDEGAALAVDMLQRLDALDALVDKVETLSARVLEAQEARLRARLEQLESRLGVPVDEARIATELVIHADKSDVTEEVVRARTHLARFRDLIGGEGDDAQGKTMDFLCQELLRELNTMGSKCRDAGVANDVVDAKVELEKLREQIQNIA